MINNIVKLEVPQDTIEKWQDIVNILAEIVKVPTCLVMRLNEPDLEVLVSSQSKGNPYHPGEKGKFHGSGLYCETVIKRQDKLLVPDALADANWKNNPDVKLNMISYLGFPISLPNGKPFGTLCVLDNQANAYSGSIEKLMLKLRNLIQSNLEIVYINQVLGDKNKRLTDYLMELQTLRGMVSICFNCKSVRDNQGQWRPIEHYLIQHPEADFSHGLCPGCMEKLYPEYNKNH